MKLPPFTHRRAESADHALQLLQAGGSEAKLLSGGQSLLPLMCFRMAAPAELIDVGGLDELAYVRRDDGGLAIGATTRHATLEAAPLGPGFEAFADALPLVGHLPIRTRGTTGGSIAHADATAELPLLARTFDATIVARSHAGTRELAAADFFVSTLTTALEATEMVVELRLPAPPAGAASGFAEFSERAGDFAFASACAALALDADGVCTWSRVGLGAVAPRPVRSPSAEQALLGQRLDAAAIAGAARHVLEDCQPRGGLHVSAEFRRELIITMTERALHAAARRATQEV